MKELNCRDAGVDCDWSVKAESEDEILAKAADHARKDHGMSEISDEMMQKVRSSIHEAKAA